MDPMFASYGIALDSLNVQNISLPEELQAMLDKRIGVNMMGGMQEYTRFQTAEAIPLAAQNEGGLAGLGAGMGVGFGVGQQMANAMGQSLSGMAPGAAGAGVPGVGGVSPAPTAVPNATPAAPVSADEIIATIEKLHGMVGKGILSQAEFETKKAELMKKLG
jgi:membrane protease subunit (stomatin/prohibitin family)